MAEPKRSAGASQARPATPNFGKAIASTKPALAATAYRTNDRTDGLKNFNSGRLPDATEIPSFKLQIPMSNPYPNSTQSWRFFGTWNVDSGISIGRFSICPEPSYALICTC